MKKPLTKSKRKGTTFHKTVELLEKSIFNKDNIEIKSPDYIEDKVTHRKREHDIVLYFQEKHHILKVAIECRDRIGKVDSPQIEAFKIKCEDTKIDKGIIVSSSGFTKPALIKASNIGIDCLTLKQVESLHWLKAKYMFIERCISKKVFVHIFSVKTLPKDIKQYDVVNSNNNIVEKSFFMNNAQNALNKSNHQLKDGTQVIRIPFNAKGLYLRDKANNKNKIPIKSFECDLTVEKKVENVPFVNYQYVDQDNKKIVSDLAVAKTKFLNKNITFTMVSGSDGINLSVHTE